MPTRIFTAREALQHNSQITAWCGCGTRDVDLQGLIDAGYGDVEFPDLRRRLFCKSCHTRIASFQVTPRCDPKTGLPRYHSPT